MNAKISEQIKFNAEILTVTSAAGSTSINRDMAGYDRAFFGVCLTSTDNVPSVVVDLMESSAATVAGTSAAGSKAGITIGGASTLVAVTAGVRELTLTMGTLSTATTPITLSLGTVTKTFQFTTSTASHNSSAWSSTLLYFGSTIDSTSNTGLQLALDSLKTAVESTVGFGGQIQCSSGTTANMKLKLRDDAVGSLGFTSTAAAVMSAACNQAVCGFDIATDELTSTLSKRYVSVKLSTASTVTQAAVSVLRSGGHYNPPAFAGLLSS